MSMKTALLAMGLLAMNEPNVYGHGVREQLEPLTDMEKQAVKEKQYRAKGLSPFYINGKEIWALNEKSAIKKERKTSCKH